MHAILFQMTLLPLTMSRFSIASLTESIVDKIVPLNRTLQMHIHLGYTFITIVILASVFFFAFFGLLCVEGDESFCEKFTSEIMLTVSKHAAPKLLSSTHAALLKLTISFCTSSDLTGLRNPRVDSRHRRVELLSTQDPV
jgi:hypothetical protein